MNELDHLHIELSGRHLIEASAGTGKTYAIACLYLRLLIEKDLLPEQILVVTYTEAATKELRHRIRSRIREALEVMGGAASGDAFLLGLLAAADSVESGRQQAGERLKRALAMFDTASIFTIHSFCMRALQDHAFESGSLYDTELVTSQTELLREIVDDFWRSRFFAEPAPLLGYALQSKLSPDGLLEFLKGMLGPRLEIVPRFTEGEIDAIEERCRAAFNKVQEEWARSRGVVEDILLNSKELGRAADSYRLNDVVPALLAGLGTLVEGDNPFALFSGFEKCCLSAIIKATKKNKVPPEHPFFSCCEELLTGVQERFLALRWEVIAFAAERLPLLKRKANVRFFDDLLVDVSAALQGEGGEACAASLGQKYPAGLIDEFQDTDPLQYDIFRRIYTGKGKVLFLIGDPKQAIYSFRGADIFAYLEAASDVSDDNTHTLTGNWRSTPRLLTAFNTLFERRSPFVFDKISYHPVSSGKPEHREELLLDENHAPLQVWHLPLGDQGKPLTVGEAADCIPPAVAGEIVRLLQAGREGKALLHGRPLVPGDMAVIVRTHREGKCIQDALRAVAVPSVMRSEQSIFGTDEAGDLYTVLNALADPGNESKVRGALVTPLLGKRGDDIARFLEDEQAWEEMLSHFRDYHHAWLERGFMVMSRWLLSRERVRGRLLQRPDGERRLTNVLHCLEVIHSAAHEKDLGMEGVLAWFGGRINGGENAEENQIRLETDEQAVRIVTIHVSKGLEYPVVFCPFLWGGVRQGDDVVSFHNGFTMGKDYGSPDLGKHQLQASREALAENLRLFYVALTRAKFRCYLVAGKIDGSRATSKPETSALAYLLHSSTAEPVADLVGELAAEVRSRSSAVMLEDLQKLESAAPGAIAVQEMPEGIADSWQPVLDPYSSFICRNFNAVIGNDWRVASFTSFAQHNAAPGERPDRDEGGALHAVSPAAGDVVGGTNIFTFPKGAQAGIFLHSLFEELDFADATGEKNRPLVEKGLARYGYEPEWLETVSSMVANVIATPLPGPDGAFTLSGLRPGAWISELEFFFPLRFVTSDLLRDVLKRWNGTAAPDEPDYLRALHFKPVRGMVRGFMDMVFEHNGRYYLLDWKSNHLGYRVEDYGQAALREEMGRKLYTLQYQLYTVALTRYLALRVPGFDYASHFGGVIYLFLRGMNPEHGAQFGVYHDLPPVELIEELSDLLVECES
ncbi:exodeoxyribonuclease V subunit beta [Pelotalea chapellei]|uniref:DNA 3'-5' helicase n=1 Tax=Pelotalea chapellei TaxID=44671 RepID=A0ABS5UBM5_9BACT|nr:exodeoxyribonuclease V subunit beta [Pelotalea chapellei]MBT1073095.1 exodeoxyribonuclease V subunit beta [Pelotalea chapellei]